jgi:hypothetical protein
VGEPTIKTVLGNRFVAGWLDTYLAKVGYDGQQAPEKVEAMLPNNLYEPATGDKGARGIFGSDARNGSPATWAIGHRKTMAAAAVTLGAAAVGGAAMAATAVVTRLRRS